MTSPVFALLLICLFLGKTAQMTNLKFPSSVRQERSFVSVKTGDSLTLKCFSDSNVPSKLYWFKQILGQNPRLISSYYKYELIATFHDEFKNNQHFTLDTENDKFHLTITNLRMSDSAIYYCIHFMYILQFSESIIVSVKDSGLNVPALVHQSESESVQPGDSVTLNCTVHTGTCDGEHSVYWFKNSEESHPGLIYTHGGRNDQCERKPDTQTHTCVYNLPMTRLNLSHAGTYYCAVASCGHILFGNGTKLDFEYKVDCFLLVYILSTALTFTIILVVLLVVSMYKMKRRNRCQSAERRARPPASSTTNTEGYQVAADLPYAALSVNRPSRSRGQRKNTEHECVYSTVKQ